MPVLGIIFLRHAATRFQAAARPIAADQASGKMPNRPIVPADYVKQRALYLPEAARYDHIMQAASTTERGSPGAPMRQVPIWCGGHSKAALRRAVTWPHRQAILQQLNLHRLLDTPDGTIIVLRARIGDTLQEGAVIAGLHGGDASDTAVLDALMTGPERTFHQDPLFAFRLLADLPATVRGPLDFSELMRDARRCALVDMWCSFGMFFPCSESQAA